MSAGEMAAKLDQRDLTMLCVCDTQDGRAVSQVRYQGRPVLSTRAAYGRLCRLEHMQFLRRETVPRLGYTAWKTTDAGRAALRAIEAAGITLTPASDAAREEAGE